MSKNILAQWMHSLRAERDAALARAEAAEQRAKVLEDIVRDMQSGFRYVRKRENHGADNPWYGFGIDRLEKAAANALGDGR